VTEQNFDFKRFPLKGYNQRLGQTLCQHCGNGVDLGEMVFHQNGEDYGYYHPECLAEATK